MFDKFGEFDSVKEINELAINLRKEGDRESLNILAKENGIDLEIAEAFLDGDIDFLCDIMAAAIGKLEVEAAELKPVEIMADWVEYIKGRCLEDDGLAVAIRKKGKSLKGAIAALLMWSFKHQQNVDKGILKAAGVSVGRCTLGIPGMGTAKKLITEYYMD
ncbi:MAG: hypothetical protein HFI23_16940 [Lachnospiraceae bacterium]|nr:hypothetical protein [Lachnospiraceae bacterium]